MSNEQDLAIIARVRRAMPRNADVMWVCQIAEEALTAKAPPKFDKVAYQREYMRGWRAKRAGK